MPRLNQCSGIFVGACLLAGPVAPAEGRIELPMLLRGAQPMVEVMVNGEGPFRFVIDTGGQGTARADAALVAKLSLAKVGEARAGDPSGKNLVTMDIVRMASLRLGSLEFKDVDAPSRDYNQGPLPAIDGILGFQIFADHLLTLDFRNRKVILEKGELDPKDQWVVKFTAPRGIPVVRLLVAGQPIDANLDTGNVAGPIIVPGEFAARLPLRGEPKVVGMARTVNSTFEIKEAQLDGDVLLGTVMFPAPAVRFPGPGRDANVGSLALADKIVTFDQKKGLVRIVTPAK